MEKMNMVWNRYQLGKKSLFLAFSLINFLYADICLIYNIGLGIENVM